MRTFSVHSSLRFRARRRFDGWFADNSLPGVGTFAYAGSPIVAAGPQAVVVAAR